MILKADSDSKERLNYIDLMKGIGIFLVVSGHAGSPFVDWIYSFHMGLFFWISGYTFAIKPLPNFQCFLKKKKTKFWGKQLKINSKKRNTI